MTPAASPVFIFMATRDDRTVPDAAGCARVALEAGVRHIGFKDIGLPMAGLCEVAAIIRGVGARLYLEVVSLDEASERRSAEAALELGVDCLMGGTRPDIVGPLAASAGIDYCPFPGEIVGHPSRLVGPAGAITASALRLAGAPGVTGLDLLAYRFAGDAAALLVDVCNTVTPLPVIVAGSIDRDERIRAVLRAGCAGFTVGTAALDGAFPAAEPGLLGQLRHIMGVAAAASQDVT